MERQDICVIAVKTDEAIANTLAESIRSYKLPGGVVLPDPSKDYRKIFVDASETPFDDSVKTLLDNTRYLIVMCSPETKVSDAVQQRLVYFQLTHSEEDTVAVLVKGEPIDSFPPGFYKKVMVQHILPDKTVYEREDTIEPIASDLRGDSPKRCRELLKYETVRIIASCLGIHPDVLEQRHRRRRNRAIAAVVGVLSAVCLVAAGIFIRLGLIARNEGIIAEKQTELSMEVAQRLGAELPALFAEDADTDAPQYIQEAIDNANKALVEAGLEPIGSVTED